MDNKTRTFSVHVVDDEEVIASTLNMILRSMGVDAVAFTRPLEAIHPKDLLAKIHSIAPKSVFG